MKRIPNLLTAVLGRSMLVLGLVLLAAGAHASALDLLIEKADRGDIAAQFDLATRYATGRSGAPFSQKLAGIYYEKAALAGHDRAMLNLGMMYEVGRGLPKDESLALYWILMAAEHGNLRAQYQMGIRFEIGHGVEPNLVLAQFWFVLASSAGSPAAGFRMPSVQSRLQDHQIAVAKRMAKNWAKGRAVARSRARERQNEARRE